MVPGDSTECATFTVTDTKPVHSPEGQVGLLVNTVEAGLLALHFNLETVQRLRLGLEAAEKFLRMNSPRMVVSAAVKVRARGREPNRVPGPQLD
jgi:hypothetical protein